MAHQFEILFSIRSKVEERLINYNLTTKQILFKDRGRKMIKQFRQQTLLLLGEPCAGKMSFINSFYYVVNRLGNKEAEFLSLDDRTRQSFTTRIRQFSKKSGMYSYLIESPYKDLRDFAAKEPVFLKTLCLDQCSINGLLQVLFRRPFLSETVMDDWHEIASDFIPDKEQKNKKLNKLEAEISADPITIIFFVTSDSYMRKLYPINRAYHIAKAFNSDSYFKKNVRIFVAATKVDKLKNGAEDEVKFQDEIFDIFGNLLGLEKKRIWPISNYTLKDRNDLGSMTPNCAKDEKFVEAFLEMLEN